ncbi:MAG: hypothetical protein AVDCRST_MAG76-2834 [uncultured Acidimicrobiales bacterium]|uniref:Uncharacterized protein n=1 Tax=uncultured Acidimicrobiales bacterium TaxID=310071 RepID=A0A6J4ITI5_9ACTN|nr:MAG: hypothetical protein AVDCRST_MAG76-2834 [uncultured Acidimicrobiales bacterium]
MRSMLGHLPSYSAQVAAERHARFAAESVDSRWRRLLNQGHPAPPCAALAAQLPDVVVDLRPMAPERAEPAARR